MIVALLLIGGVIAYEAGKNKTVSAQSAASTGNTVRGSAPGFSTVNNGISAIEKAIQAALMGQKKSSGSGSARPSAGAGGGGVSGGSGGGGSQTGFGQPSNQQIIDTTPFGTWDPLGLNKPNVIDTNQGQAEVNAPDPLALSISQSSPGDGTPISQNTLDLSAGLPTAANPGVTLDPSANVFMDPSFDPLANFQIDPNNVDLSGTEPFLNLNDLSVVQ